MDTSSYNDDFGPFEGNLWINCAHQGPLPRTAIEQAHEAVEWKRAPFELTTERFSGVPSQLKKALSRLIHAHESEIILGNSASYGLHLLANGLPLTSGDEILLTKGDFPSVLYPWLGLQKNGIKVRLVEPRNHVLSPEELRNSFSPSTRVFCSTWVHSFSGRAIDLDAMGTLCREHGVWFIANTSQAIGTREFDVSQNPVDAIVNVGHKWLCGPYGTGFCWMTDALLQELTYNQAYWLSMQTADDLGKASTEITLPEGPRTGRTYDTFGTANFFNFVPWTASIEYLLNQGISTIAQHNQALVDFFIDRLDASKYHLLSPRSGPDRSTLILISHVEPERNQFIYDYLKTAEIHIAFRRGNLRIAPHLYNTSHDLTRLLDALHAV